MKKAPVKKKSTAKKTIKSPVKTATKKAGAKRTAKKAAVKKAVKKQTPKKATPKKAAVKKTTAKKPAAKKVASKKAAAVKKNLTRKTSVEKTPAKKPSVKATAKKVTRGRTTPKKGIRKSAVTKQLTKSDIAKFQKMLLAERDRLTATINNIEEASRTESGRDNGADLASFAETGTDSFNLETALNIAGTESQRLRDVIDALDRIERGTYGICEGSGKLIPKKRLEAFPSARYCLEYQQELEKEAASNEYR